MANIFDFVPRPKLKRSHFNLSHPHITSFDMGKLVPVLCAEVLPGDKWRQKTIFKCISSPFVAPVFSDVSIRHYSFFAPSRLLTPDWERIIAGKQNDDAADTTPDGVVNRVPGITFETLLRRSTAIPGVTGRNYVAATRQGSLWDYLGLPPISTVNAGLPTSAPQPDDLFLSELPFRGYQRIYFEWFRNEDTFVRATPYTDCWTISGPCGSGTGAQELVNFNQMLSLRSVQWEKDYLTSALPWPQRGPTVYIPGVNPDVPEDGTIANLAVARAVKRFLDVAARAGNRLKEHYFGHWGVNNRDERLQRTEYLCGTRSPLFVSEVLQTSSTDTTSPQANPSGLGQSINSAHQFTHYVPEDGYIFTIAVVVPRPVYQQNIHRMWLRQTKFDYALPEFANLPEQEINTYEALAPWLRQQTRYSGVFGYTGRFNEYRYLPGRVSGAFRTGSSDAPLDYWHFGRDLLNEGLGSNNPISISNPFTTATVPTRPFAIDPTVYPNQSLWFEYYHEIHVRRSLPKHGIGQY